MQDLVSVISSLGFPIVCCFFLWKYINTTMIDFTQVIRENTTMLGKICDRLDMYETEKKEGVKNEKPPDSLLDPVA